MPPTRFGPFAQPDPVRVPTPVLFEGAADPPAEDDYPPIEQFLDELPSIDDYLAEDAPSIDDYLIDDPSVTGMPDAAETTTASVTDETEGWGTSGWQSYDWNAVAALGHEPLDSEAAAKSWNPAEWPETRSGETRALSDSLSVSAGGGTSAEDVANALDDIAYRIRSGQLAIDQFRGTPPEAAMAAALAALLRSRSD